MDRIRRQKTFLKAITSAANRNAKKALIKQANKDQVNAVSEIVMNLLKKQRARHARHHGQIKTLQTNPETNWKSSRIA